MKCLYCKTEMKFAGYGVELYTYVCPKCGDKTRENLPQHPIVIMEEESTQESGLTDYELEIEKIVYKIRKEPNTLICINILREFINTIK